jgi:hypothetical protein
MTSGQEEKLAEIRIQGAFLHLLNPRLMSKGFTL